jgi:2-polyprenyl-3-methyl-5-hydroxy-6-metoxy-1,4-benzoquinol methylase
VVSAVDNIRDYWERRIRNLHYYVMDDDVTRPELSERYDAITCISVLEHITDPDAAIAGMFSLLECDGHLLLSFPFHEDRYVRNVYELPDSLYGGKQSYICQCFSRSELARWLATHDAEIVHEEYWQLFTGEVWTQGKLVRPPVASSKEGPHQLLCVVLRRKPNEGA